MKAVFLKLLFTLTCICSLWHNGLSANELITEEIPHSKSIIDMAGRKVIVPYKISRIATVGSVPVINSYLFALGEGKKIVNGLPLFAKSNRYNMQTAIAPHLAKQPMIQGQSRDLNMEVLFKLNPDVVITMDMFMVNMLERYRMPVVFIEWRDSSEILSNMKILGNLLDRMIRTKEYLLYFEVSMKNIRNRLSGISKNEMPVVLYFSPDTLTTPLLIADWWIKEAGGISVTAGIKRTGKVSFSHEQVLIWNPDIMIVASPSEISKIYKDKRLSGTHAVINKKVYSIPMGAHSWGQRTVEQALTVLWAAKMFYPDRFRHISIEDEVRSFYRRFFDYKLSDSDIKTILAGGIE